MGDSDTKVRIGTGVLISPVHVLTENVSESRSTAHLG